MTDSTSSASTPVAWIAGVGILADKGVGEDELKTLDKDIRKIVADDAAFAEESPEPEASELYTDVLVDTY